LSTTKSEGDGTMKSDLGSMLSQLLKELGEDYGETMGLLEELKAEGLPEDRVESIVSGLLASACRLHKHTYGLQELMLMLRDRGNESPRVARGCSSGPLEFMVA
jgi:hypothetical protein